MASEHREGQNIIITNADNFYRHLDELLSSKMENLRRFLEEKELASAKNDWLHANVFCSRNEISSTTLFRYVRDGLVEKRSLDKRNIKYRWKAKPR